MHRTSPICSSNSFPQPLSSPPILRRRTTPLRWLWRPTCAGTPSSFVKLPSPHLQSFRPSLPSLRRVATHEIVEPAEAQLGFVEIGYISNVHGIQGELRVKPTTGFPELRFSEPGRRWLRQQILGKETVQEVELVEGRGHPGQKTWILKFEGIDTVEQAKLLIGSTLLVREGDRPELEEGEYYSRDLVGMKVVLKETGGPVGTVVNVFDSGGNDLLQVILDCSEDTLETTGNLTSTDAGVSARHIWIPFVEEIVPHVDVNRREMQITPPKGLLELNLRSNERSKKERRQLEWKERKKFQKRLIAAKKKLCEMEQEHVFHGFRFGEKAQGRVLADQIVGVNSKLLQQALQHIEIPSKRWTVTELFNATESKLIRNTLRISERCLTLRATNEKLGENLHLQEKGLHLISAGKTAVVLVVNNEQRLGYDPDAVDPESSENQTSLLLQTLLDDDQKFVKIEDRPLVPLVLVSSASRIALIETLFLNNDHFGFDSQKIWFLEEEKLPVVSILVEENRRKILMKSPWEILQSPVGSGGVMNLLSSHNVIDNLSEMGVEYVEICSSSQRIVGMNILLLGLVNSSRADMGIQLLEDTTDFEESFDMIFSMNLLKNLTKQSDKLQFNAIPTMNSHVELADKEWVDVAAPSAPNSYEFRCSIYSSLNSGSLDKVCAIEIAE